jgi:hypothetical protein
MPANAMGETSENPGENTASALDASVAPRVAVQPAVVDAAVAVVMVPVQIRPGLLSSCADGEEMNIAGPNCVAPVGLESALRERLTATLGQCPAALEAARDTTKLLSLGLRVDFTRRTVVSLLGRSSSVPEKVSYVPCANTAMRSFDELWRMTAAHPRYQYFFTARFGPVPVGASVPVVATAVPATTSTPSTTPEPPTPQTPTPSSTDGGTQAPVVDPTLPTAAQMLRMPAMATATVTWTTAIVRDSPRTGLVSGRVSSGTSVEIIDRRGSWYGIRWAGGHTGWTYGEAIGQGRTN